MEYFLEGAKIIQKEKRLWKYIYWPLAVSGILFLIAVSVAYLLIVPWVTNSLQAVGLKESVALMTGVLLFILVLILASGTLYLSLTSLVGSFLWDRLSKEVELIATGEVVDRPASIGFQLADGFLRAVFVFCLGLLAGCGVVTLGILSIIVAGIAGLFDCTAPALMRRRIGFFKQWRHVFKSKGSWTFIICAGTIALAPVLNVLFMPVMIAAGTVMVARSKTVASAVE